MELYLKHDHMQYTGRFVPFWYLIYINNDKRFDISFKERGASYAISQLSECQKKIGVIAASAGNHAQAVSYHGLKVDMPVTVVMPLIAPVMKIQKCKNLKVLQILTTSPCVYYLLNYCRLKSSFKVKTWVKLSRLHRKCQWRRVMHILTGLPLFYTYL